MELEILTSTIQESPVISLAKRSSKLHRAVGGKMTTVCHFGLANGQTSAHLKCRTGSIFEGLVQ